MEQRTKITSLPSRYEPLVRTFGERAQMTFVPSEEDLAVAKRLIARAESAGQGKLMMVSARSGSGKSTFIHSLEVFLADKVSAVVRLPEPHELPVGGIPAYLSGIPVRDKFTVVNFDGREAPSFDPKEYKTFLGQLNAILRARRDLIVLWPIVDEDFASRVVGLLRTAGGNSAFGAQEVHDLVGLRQSQFRLVLEKILQVANWRLEDAAISSTEVDVLQEENGKVGDFLDALQNMIAERFEVDTMGLDFPQLVIAVSSGEPKIREVCRGLRRADSFYLEASRLLMYTKKSNAAEWWENRSTRLRSALPHVIALFNAQLVSLSASTVVHAILRHGEPDLQALVQGVRADRGNAGRVMRSSELFKFVQGQALDNREYGSNVKEDTYESFARLQAVSKTRHRAINEALVAMLRSTTDNLPVVSFETTLRPGLQTDASYIQSNVTVALEFHHKETAESNNNKIAIYVLEKLREYAINYGLADR